MARFCSRGTAALQGLNGDYLIAVWEKASRRLTIINDRLGLRRLYYWVSGNRLAFAPSLLAFTALPGFPQTIDECALADYLATGHHLDGRTWYSAVRLLLPASVLKGYLEEARASLSGLRVVSVELSTYETIKDLVTRNRLARIG